MLRAYGNTVMFMATGGGLMAGTDCHHIIPYGGVYTVDKEGKLNSIVQIWNNDPSQVRLSVSTPFRVVPFDSMPLAHLACDQFAVFSDQMSLVVTCISTCSLSHPLSHC